MAPQLKVCDACAASVTVVSKRDFGKHACPKQGHDAQSPDHKACPTHGTLIWTVGPYSTYRVCGMHHKCTSGVKGKPYRYCAPRGESRSGDDDEDEIPAKDTVGFPPTKYADPPSKEVTQVKAAAPIANATGVTLSMLGSLGETIQAYVDARATELATEIALNAVSALDDRQPLKIEWNVNGNAFAKIDGAHHKALPEILKRYAMGFRNFFIAGPAGSGKTTLAHNLATTLGKQWYSVSCTQGMSESALTGRAIPNLSTGETVYQSTDFVRSYEDGGVFLIDEVDAADANVMLTINAALANGHMPLPNRVASPSATRHDDAVVICAANTWGNGADRQYVGRNQLDGAFLDRFVGATFDVDYDRDLESQLVSDAHICARVWTMRDKITDLKLRRIVGTRFLMSVARIVKAGGESIDKALLACTVGWTVDERSKVGVR